MSSRLSEIYKLAKQDTCTYSILEEIRRIVLQYFECIKTTEWEVSCDVFVFLFKIHNMVFTELVKKKLSFYAYIRWK